MKLHRLKRKENVSLTGLFWIGNSSNEPEAVGEAEESFRFDWFKTKLFL